MGRADRFGDGAEQPDLETTALTLYGAGKPELAADVLTRYIDTQAADVLDLGQALLGSIEARTKVLYGQRKPQTDEMSKLDYQMVTCK